MSIEHSLRCSYTPTI